MRRAGGLIGLCCATLLLAAAPAGATTTAVIGPPTNNAAADTGPISCGSDDCVSFNTADDNGGLIGAPGPGTVTGWTAGGLQGSGRLVVLRPIGNGELEIVAESAEETEPCTGGQGFVCGGITPDPNVYTFPTNLPIAAGDQIGIELISTSECNAPNSLPGAGCASIGENPSLTRGGPDNGRQDFFEHTPPLNSPTGTTASVPLGGQVLVDATETLTDITSLQLQAIKNACASAPQGSLQSILASQGYSLSFDSAEPGELSGNVSYIGSSGGSVLTFEGSGGGSVLVYIGSGGGSVLVYEGSGGGSVLTYDGSGGGSVLTFNGSNGGSVLTYEGSGGGSSVAADPGSVRPAVAQTLQCGAALGINVATAAAKAKSPSKVRICIRKDKHSAAHCKTFRRVALPAVATGSQRVTGAGKVTLKLKLTNTGRLLLLAGKEADRVYRLRHPHARTLPKLALKVSLAFSP